MSSPRRVLDTEGAEEPSTWRRAPATSPSRRIGRRVGRRSDITPEHFDDGRLEARAGGVELEWVQADPEDLPFDDHAFDVVTHPYEYLLAIARTADHDDAGARPVAASTG